VFQRTLQKISAAPGYSNDDKIPAMKKLAAHFFMTPPLVAYLRTV
jgi:hypothetical protein